jgi:hypothetical protein
MRKQTFLHKDDHFVKMPNRKRNIKNKELGNNKIKEGGKSHEQKNIASCFQRGLR